MQLTPPAASLAGMSELCCMAVGEKQRGCERIEEPVTGTSGSAVLVRYRGVNPEKCMKPSDLESVTEFAARGTARSNLWVSRVACSRQPGAR